MDLSGAYISYPISGSIEFIDCSGNQCLSNPYTNNDDVHLSEIRRRIVYSNSNHVFETPIENIDEMRSYLNAKMPTESFLYYSVRLFNSIWSFISDTIMVTQKVGNGVWVAFQPETYYFFKDSAHPWDARRITLSYAGSPHVELFYNADTRCFSRQENDGHLHHFPYLTAEIYHGNLALYDITSFTESLKWTGGDSDNPPSANHVLSAWTLYSGILLDPSLPLVLKVITEDGDESTIPLHIPIN